MKVEIFINLNQGTKIQKNDSSQSWTSNLT
jgi:hypothetical protein